MFDGTWTHEDWFLLAAVFFGISYMLKLIFDD